MGASFAISAPVGLILYCVPRVKARLWRDFGLRIGAEPCHAECHLLLFVSTADPPAHGSHCDRGLCGKRRPFCRCRGMRRRRCRLPRPSFWSRVPSRCTLYPALLCACGCCCALECVGRWPRMGRCDRSRSVVPVPSRFIMSRCLLGLYTSCRQLERSLLSLGFAFACSCTTDSVAGEGHCNYATGE